MLSKFLLLPYKLSRTCSTQVSDLFEVGTGTSLSLLCVVALAQFISGFCPLSHTMLTSILQVALVMSSAYQIVPHYSSCTHVYHIPVLVDMLVLSVMLLLLARCTHALAMTLTLLLGHTFTNYACITLVHVCSLLS